MPTQDDFERFDDYYNDAKVQTDERISEVLEGSEDFNLKRRALEHSVRGGKRVRPVLTLLMSDVYDSPFHKAINHAVVVELIHNGSLVADDRADMDAGRRGDSTLWKVVDRLPLGKRGDKFVTRASILTANGLVGVALKLVKDPDVVAAVGSSLDKLLDGFFLEGYSTFTGYVSGGYERYIETNKAKTGGLFALSTWMPAEAVDVPEEQVEAARKYGEIVGIMYQIADDTADDDLPSFIKDPDEELEKWYDRALEHIEAMPDGENKDLLEVAPAWMVWKMGKQEGVEFNAEFIPNEMWSGN
jgi:octaprenyl-diphosphate synthase